MSFLLQLLIFLFCFTLCFFGHATLYSTDILSNVAKENQGRLKKTSKNDQIVKLRTELTVGLRAWRPLYNKNVMTAGKQGVEKEMVKEAKN